MPDPKRVVVFIDYQNVYKRARGCFFPNSPSHVDGQVHPRRLALKLKGVGRDDRQLVGVRVYRGLPSNRHSPKGYGAARRQIDLWKHTGIVTAIYRDINYRDPDNPKEKGIDVAIAVDFVAMAVRGEYDVGILFSGDTDLLPALEAVRSLPADRQPEIEVATWQGDNPGSVRQLRLDEAHGGGPVCHILRRVDYEHVRDDTDYVKKRRRR